MHYSSFIYNQAKVNLSTFGSSSNNGELHAVVSITNPCLPFSTQLEEAANAFKSLVDRFSSEGYSVAMIRLLLSDAANQAETAMASFSAINGHCALGYVQQPPLNGTKIAAVIYMIQGISTERVDKYTVMGRRGDFTHFWSASVCNAIANTHSETETQLSYLEDMLHKHGLNIADNCVRTWFFVQNIDVNYGAVVKARRDNFNNNGLTVDTHYIASTGIGGRHALKEVTSILDAYCIGGLRPGQMGYLYASDNMNRTSEYGVTFERGTYVDFDDRREIFISGTASIDNKGNVVAEGDIVAQTQRMILNVKALLSEANASNDDIAHIVVYLRDIADYTVARQLLTEEFGDTPLVITLAPVCRPGWLIEMECVAIAPITSNTASV
ncbi:MAG: Rid family hydrolase [Bacteroidales bacterium]|nr:Rid family hydrolase [Bacteroidales bacterium]